MSNIVQSGTTATSKAPLEHQQTVDRLCNYLGVPTSEVSVSMRRTGGQEGLQRVENLKGLADCVRDSDLAHLVPDDL